MKTYIMNIYRKRLLLLSMLALLAIMLCACSDSGNSVPQKGSGISFRLAWPVAKTVASALPPAVVTVRMSIASPYFATISKDFLASDHSGTITGVPSVADVTISFQGFDAYGLPIYRGDVPGLINLVGIDTLNCGTVPMAVVGAAIPTAPASGSVTAVSNSHVDVFWTDNSDNETGFRIERKTGATGNFTHIGAVAANVGTFTDTTVAATTTYYYRVLAGNGIGYSLPTAEVSVMTPEVTYTISGTITSAGVPLAGVAVSMSGSTTPVVTDTEGKFVLTGARNGISYVVTPSRSGYDIAAQTVPVAGNDVVAVNFIATANSTPAAPSALSATVASASTIALSWHDNAQNEAGYLVERGTVSGSFAPIATLAADATQYVDVSLHAGTTYYYRILASNALGTAQSAEVSATTLAAASSFTPVMVQVPGGTYSKGNASSATVNTFYIGKYEVTQREWSQVMLANPSLNVCLDCPVERVSWQDVQAFVTKLNQLSGKTYRLPTDTEWEYAARYGGMDLLYSGSNVAGDVAWFKNNSLLVTHVRGGKSPNALGLYDMSGNVGEWVSDLYETPPDSSYTYRVMRGGWSTGVESQLLVITRAFYAEVKNSAYIGFRLASDTP